MKIIFWNAYHGFSKSSDAMLPPTARKAAFADWLSEQQPDTSIFLEAIYRSLSAMSFKPP